jgi:hypothetical protein
MKSKIVIAYLLVGLFLSGILACAEEEGAVEIVAKMKTRLKLTQSQVIAVNPIIEEYVDKRQHIMQGLAIPLMADRKSIESQLMRLKEKEKEKLSQVLTPDQLKKWEYGESMKDFLNQDEMNFTDRAPQGNATGF